MGRLYFAYGMNMDRHAMARRCPAASFVGPARLPGHRFGINLRGVSTVLPAPETEVHGVLWTLTASCEASLDRYEGVAAGHYAKREYAVLAAEEERPALLYIATDPTAGPPRQPYFDTVCAAARQHGFPAAYLALLDRLR